MQFCALADAGSEDEDMVDEALDHGRQGIERYLLIEHE